MSRILSGFALCGLLAGVAAPQGLPAPQPVPLQPPAAPGQPTPQPAPAPAQPAAPQAVDRTGAWRCQLGNQTVSNNPFETWLFTFDLTLTAGGSFSASGFYQAASMGYNDPFTASGSWSESSDKVGMFLDGQAIKASGNMPWRIGLRYDSATSMSYSFQSAYGIMSSACQR